MDIFLFSIFNMFFPSLLVFKINAILGIRGALKPKNSCISLICAYILVASKLLQDLFTEELIRVRVMVLTPLSTIFQLYCAG